MYKKVTTDMNFCERETQVLDYWKKHDIVRKSIAPRPDREPYTFYDGPPTANGMPHAGHLITRSIKDLFPRYYRMKGYDVFRKAGWDTHGLPVELEVEKMLGLDGKEQIEEYGVEPFIAECKKSVWKYKGEWENMSDRIAFWADMDNPYITYENTYIESIWWSLKQLWEKDLLYKGYKVVPYCPRCGTALSSHEVAQGYKDVTEDSLYVKFKLADEDVYAIAWTTTPWTLPSNVGLCVNPDEDYAYIETCEGEKYLLSKARIEVLFGEHAHIIKECKGKDLQGKKYLPLFDFQPDVLDAETAWRIVCDNYVTLTDGSGIVHIAPAFGEDDNRISNANGLPFVQLVDTTGCFDERTPWKGMFVKEADPVITQLLEKQGQLFKVEENEHNYPFCWRCDTPLLYYARSSWFIKMTAMRDKLVENNNGVNWVPENIKAGRMGNFVEGVIDWGLSRERYWGTPLPIWECECGHRECVGSREELREKGGQFDDDIELHKPFIDNVTIPCPECGKQMTRIPEVIDCWYDSGAMPFAQFHYPFENKDMFERYYPATFISEAVDQTRGWFYTLLAISTCLFDEPSFENCIVLGHVQDKNGQKMSKHKGNVIDPWSVLSEQGADATRWYFYAASSPWLPSRFSQEAVTEMQRKFMGTLWNTYAFYILYADIDGYDPTDKSLPEPQLATMDRWVLSRLNSLVAKVRGYLDEYKVTEPARAIQDFVDDLSNWYVRRCRERYWGSEMTADKSAAYHTLFTVLETLSRLLAPFTPFMAEAIYQNIVKSVDADAPESVHLCDYPEADASMIDENLDEQMGYALRIVALGRAARNSSNVKTRQPLGVMLLQADADLQPMFEQIVLEELNVKKLEKTNNAEQYISYSLKPQQKTLGPKYGKLLPKIKDYLLNADGSAIVAEVAGDGVHKAVLDGQQVEFGKDDLLIETVQKEGYAAASERGLSVVLDISLTPELVEEGYVREIVSRVQTMRKDAGFDVTDHIQFYYSIEDAGLKAAVVNNIGVLKSDLLADIIIEGSGGSFSKEQDINGLKALLSISRVGA